MSATFNLADLFEIVADAAPDRLALAHDRDGVTRSWHEVDRRSNALARHLTRSHRPGDKLAIYSYNRPEFVESLIGAMKARLAPVNVNYRYREQELAYLFDNSDSSVVVYEATFADNVAKLRERLPGVREWIEIADGTPGNDFAVPYEEICAPGADRLDLKRSPEDLILLYTGGTTGMPKGVMWTQAALWRALGGGGNPILGTEASEGPEQHRERVAEGKGALRLLPACPLMHGTGQFTAYNALANGGAIVTLPNRRFDAAALWDTVEARQVQALAIVGDAFGKPMLRALEDRPGERKLDACFLIVSSGVLWSPPVKRALLEHLPHAVLQDSFGSSEAIGFGTEITTRDSSVKLGKFRLGPNCKVFTPEGAEVAPGSEVAGFVARSGPIPLGYYKDEAKTAQTFMEIQGRRWSIPGDWCTVNADGTLNLLGRGSVCINSGGEKIHPEEVEETLKLHPAVADAVVVGIPDEKWGEAVSGVYQCHPGSEADEAELREHVREHLAAYKVPKHLVQVDSVGRAPSGKVDYKAAKKRVLSSRGS